MATRYTFDNRGEYFNSALSSATSSTSYTIQSFGVNKRVPDYTTVTSSEGRSAVIHWGHKDRVEAFQIGGETYPVRDISKAELVPNMMTGYRWRIGSKEWQSSYHKQTKTWRVFAVRSGVADPNPIVIFHQHKSKLLAKSERPAVIVEPAVSQDDLLTILLLLLWCRHLRMKAMSDRRSEAVGWAILGCICSLAVC